ncbi:hypothetical protein D3C86_2031990 [compost metagenome]
MLSTRLEAAFSLLAIWVTSVIVRSMSCWRAVILSANCVMLATVLRASALAAEISLMTSSTFCLSTAATSVSTRSSVFCAFLPNWS